MSDQQNQNEAACGGSALTAELGKVLTDEDVRRITREEIAAREAAYARLQEEARWR